MLVDTHTHNLITEHQSHISITDLSKQTELIKPNMISHHYFSIGIHPVKAKETTESDIQNFTLHSAHPNCVAIGECGLDKRCDSSFERQREIFLKQIERSEELKKVLIIHCVGYFNELLSLKKMLKPTQCWIIHGFRGKPQLARQLLNAGNYLSYGEHFNEESLKVTPIEKILIETDTSKLNIETIYNRIARTINCSINDLSAGMDIFET